ncbi:hypothetical protein N1851_018604 [Merluccius polli]|uniref:Uncharacterized protein n=1 Tax=Merluccius polli TaxID=89951 RepID=A0AA47P185_MERPO|nr:hypothetical protein N1851_018604 [Merluccius polli]
MLTPYEPARSLRSAGDALLNVPRSRLKTRGDRAFSTRAPRLWNDLPAEIRLAESGRGNESDTEGADTGDAATSTGDENSQKTGQACEDGHDKGLPPAEQALHPGLEWVVQPRGFFQLRGQGSETIECFGNRPIRGSVVGDERATLVTEHSADTSFLGKEHVQGYAVLERH